MRWARLFVMMLLEDWRLQTGLFGRARFALFPLQILVFVAVAAALLSYTAIDAGHLILGTYALVFLFGLQLGGAVFEGRDAMENVLGEVTFLIFSARILPVDPRSLLAVFLLKDLVYYAGLFIVPVTVGLVPFFALTDASIAPAGLAALFVGLSLTFVLGTATMVVVVSLLQRGAAGRVAAVAGVVGVVAAWSAGVPVHAYTPYRLADAGGVVDGLVAVASVVGVAALAVAAYSVAPRVRQRTRRNRYRGLADRLPGAPAPITPKTLLDIHRSAGSFLKVGLFAAILWLAAAGSLWGVETALGLTASPGLAFGALLALTGFTTGVWVTQFDDVAEYTVHPIAIDEVFAAKRGAFVILTPAIGAVFYGAALVAFPTGPLDAALGAVAFLGLSLYVYGLSSYLAGMDPHDFMFDTRAFSTFWVAVLLAVIPVLLVAFVPVRPGLASAGVVALVLVAAAVGWACTGRAVDRWAPHYTG